MSDLHEGLVSSSISALISRSGTTWREPQSSLITATNGGRSVPPWRMHDLRRTFVSGCARLRIPSEVTERAINHVSESFGGVRGIYNVHAYEEERRNAMRAWADHLTSTATPPTGKIRALRR